MIRSSTPSEYRRVLRSFTPTQRGTFDLYFAGAGLTQSQVAELQGRSQQAVAKTVAAISRKFINAGLPEPLVPRPDAPWGPDG